MHISIEGIDGVGKTTIATIVAKELGYTFVDKPLQYLFDDKCGTNYIRIRDKVNQNKNRVFTSWFYGLGNIYLYEHFKNQDIITDRHLLSNFAWSGEIESEEVFDLLVDKTPAPDFTFIIYASKETITKRIKNRDELDLDVHKLTLHSKVYEKMEAFCEKYKMPYKVIDTTDLTIQEVKQIIVTKILLMRESNV